MKTLRVGMVQFEGCKNIKNIKNIDYWALTKNGRGVDTGYESFGVRTGENSSKVQNPSSTNQDPTYLMNAPWRPGPLCISTNPLENQLALRKRRYFERRKQIFEGNTLGDPGECDFQRSRRYRNRIPIDHGYKFADDDVLPIFRPFDPREYHKDMAIEMRISRRLGDWAILGRYGVNTAYKRKGEKVRPINTSESTGEKPGGLVNWKPVVLKLLMEERKRHPPLEPPNLPYMDHIIPKVSTIARGSRLTPERLRKLRLSMDLTSNEKMMLVEILFTREAALA